MKNTSIKFKKTFLFFICLTFFPQIVDGRVAEPSYGKCNSKKCLYYVPELRRSIMAFHNMYYFSRDTTLLRYYLQRSDSCRDKNIMDIGTGVGVLALVCLKLGAKKAVATDINKDAIENTKYNSRLFGYNKKLEARLVPSSNPGAYSVLKKHEKFDLIISNPPWFNAIPSEDLGEDGADPGYRLLKSIIADLEKRLSKNGKLILVYGHKEPIALLTQIAHAKGFKVNIIDGWDLAKLDASKIDFKKFQLKNGDAKPEQEIPYAPIIEITRK